MKLYENIKKYRKERGWTQEELGKLTGYERSMIAKIESGKVDLSQSKIKMFSDIFGMSASDLMGVQDEAYFAGSDDAELLYMYHLLNEPNKKILKATLNALVAYQLP